MGTSDTKGKTMQKLLATLAVTAAGLAIGASSASAIQTGFWSGGPGIDNCQGAYRAELQRTNGDGTTPVQLGMHAQCGVNFVGSGGAPIYYATLTSTNGRYSFKGDNKRLDVNRNGTWSNAWLLSGPYRIFGTWPARVGDWSLCGVVLSGDGRRLLGGGCRNLRIANTSWGTSINWI